MKLNPLQIFYLIKDNDGAFITMNASAYKPLFIKHTRQDYLNEGIPGIEPMTAQELNFERDEQTRKLYSTDCYAEEKFDGTRAILHIGKQHSRIFSRNISTKSNWYNEFTDSLPQLRGLSSEQYEGTILDGELLIPNRPFKDISATMNCLWDEAINRQLKLGFAVLNVFDIVHYRGLDIIHKPLAERKRFLREVVKALHSAYLSEVLYFDDTITVVIPESLVHQLMTEYYYKISGEENLLYPNLSNLLAQQIYGFSKDITGDFKLRNVDKQTYYEYIVAMGGEGIILKDKSAPYEHKRSKAFLKVKKNFTREVIITGFSEPTKEYNGKLPETWNYWENSKTGEIKVFDWSSSVDNDYYARNESHLIPVSKYYAEHWVGNIQFGVAISDDEVKTLSKKKTFYIQKMRFGHKIVNVIEIGECAGFDEETRHMFSSQYLSKDGYIHCITDTDYERAERNEFQPVQWEGKVIEVLANDLFKDTGKLRHPRFLRLREDKSPLECNWKNHIA
ncbi:MAG: hypothetical protein LBS84_02335 [Clostridiales bacterium]|jgi:ATP-dependent DNA ligase|nr:hypothetical protein [Clostridiales bacterium]